MTSSKISSAPTSRRDRAQRLEIGLVGGRQPRAVRHRIDQHAGELRAMLADQADRRLGVVEGDGDDIGQHIVRRTLRIGHRNRRIAAPGLRHGIEADFGIVIGAVIGALAFCDLRPAGKRARGLQRHHHGLGAGIGEAHLLDRRAGATPAIRPDRSRTPSAARTPIPAQAVSSPPPPAPDGRGHGSAR